MDVALEQLIRYELREASNQGLSGFVYDRDLEEQDKDWQYFEDMAIEEIKNKELEILWEKGRKQ